MSAPENRHRVKEVLNRFNEAGNDPESRLWIIKQLAKENHLSDDQYLELSKMIDELDIKKLADVIKETKFGQGMDFMPRKTTVLLDNLSSMLNELFQRKAISEERYNELKKEYNIL